MVTYRQQQALAVRAQIHQLMALLDEVSTEFPQNDDFKHYHGIFEFCRSMVYREEIRLDKIIALEPFIFCPVVVLVDQ